MARGALYFLRMRLPIDPGEVMLRTQTPRWNSAGAGSSSVASKLTCGGASLPSAGRLCNEDCLRVEDSLQLMLVADGMGGHPGGDIASHLAADAIVEYLADPPTGIDRWPYGFDRSLSIDGNRLRTAIHAAHLRLLESTLAQPQLQGMGTTVVAAIEGPGSLAVAWVGDSRLYLLGPAGLRQITRDDSWIEAALAERPDANRDALRNHPLRNALTNVLGANIRLDVHVLDVPLDETDVVALTTDGVHGTLVDRDLRHLLARRLDPARAAADIVSAALSSGSPDDCTAIVGRFL